MTKAQHDVAQGNARQTATDADALTHSDAATSSPSPSQLIHDLANLLQGMQLLVELIKRTLPEDSPVQTQLASLNRAATDAGKLCKRLQCSISGEPAGTAQRQAIDLNTLIHGMQPMLDVMLRSRGTLNTVLDDALPPIFGDPSHLHEVLLDLFTNAAESLGGDSGVVTIRTGCDGQRVYFEIADNGCGMDEQTLQNLFATPFTAKSNGHGLGLVSVLSVVRQHGGTVTADSQVGKGTTVRCSFPCLATAPAMPFDIAPTQSNTIARDTSTPSAAILLVEDDESGRAGSITHS